MFRKVLIFSVMVSLCVSTDARCSIPDPDGLVTRTIQEYIEILETGEELVIDGVKLVSGFGIPTLYERREFHPLWGERAIEQMVSAIDDSVMEGLDPSDYHQAQITWLRSDTIDGGAEAYRNAASLDLLLSDALIRLAYHYYYGKVDPRRFTPEWSFTRPLTHPDTLQRIQEVVETATVYNFLNGLKPQTVQYLGLKNALATYSAIRNAGGWKTIPPGPVLQNGQRDERVPLLRSRLAMTDGSVSTDSDPLLFDEPLEKALKNFQRRHRLGDNGRLDHTTLAELNRPVEFFIDMIRANLEQARWVMHNIPDRFLVADIAGFHVYLMENGRILARHRIQVGHPYRKTPVFRSVIRHFVLNPTWTVPPGVMGDTVLPNIQQDAGYLKKSGFVLLDLKGREIDPGSIDWQKVKPGSFPYRLRKPPGPENPMGLIKIMFPNPYMVYLHDTNEKAEFDNEWRAGSAGCIRVENPLDLAEKVINEEKWDRKEFDKIIKSGKPTTVFLKRPVPILLIYQTVTTDDTGTVFFREDFYERDKAIVRGLAQPFSLHDIPAG